MIAKERNENEHRAGGRLADAGAAAEAQMAFYLRRALADDPRIIVFNDLRIAGDDVDDWAQVDHLILHPCGLIVIESKSVTGTVTINGHGEWARITGDRRRGMASPIHQAGRQAELLRARLRREFGVQTHPSDREDASFDRRPFDILVAISDHGIIERSVPAPEVHKADAVPHQVAALVHRRGSEAGRRGLPPPLTGHLMQSVIQFLLDAHTPLHAAPQVAKVPPRPLSAPASPLAGAVANPSAEVPDVGVRTCRACGSRALHLQHGRFGYYFRCINCTQNTPIDFACPRCSKRARVRKEGLRFFRECEACGFGELFYVNASLVDL